MEHEDEFAAWAARARAGPRGRRPRRLHLPDPAQRHPRLAAPSVAARARGGAADPRAFTWLPDARTALTVISRSGTAELALLRIEGDTLRKDVLDLDVPAEQVRTTPLPDGRVAVSWADGSRFVDLG